MPNPPLLSLIICIIIFMGLIIIYKDFGTVGDAKKPRLPFCFGLSRLCVWAIYYPTISIPGRIYLS
jgi:hypothetical protein